MPVPSCVILASVGPGDLERERATDLLESVFFHEPDARVLLIDDAPEARDLGALCATRIGKADRVATLANPRRRRGDWWSGGLCVGILAGLRWIHEHVGDGVPIVKVDTDTLIIGRFADTIRERFAALPSVGALGCHRLDPNGRVRPWHVWAGPLKTLLKPVCLRGRYLQVTLWGRPRKCKKVVLQALKNGYEWSEHLMGGAYAMRRDLVARMASMGHLDDIFAWFRAGCTEDVMMGVYVRATGYSFAECNRDGEPFGVIYRGLPDTPERLVARGFSIIHSLKDHKDEVVESEVRRFFAELRRRVVGSERSAQPALGR